MATNTKTTTKKTRTAKTSGDLKATVYTAEGKKGADISLPEDVFGVSWNSDLVHQVVSVIRGNQATRTAHAKDRGERRGGGKKPWRQKGTGRARHGSVRSPIWRKGGVTHGPTNEKVLTRKVNKKMRQKALRAVLSRKFKEGEVLFVDSMAFDKPETKQARTYLEKLQKVEGFDGIVSRRRNASYILSTDKNTDFWASFRNFSNITTADVRSINILDLATHKYLIIESPKDVIRALEATDKKETQANEK